MNRSAQVPHRPWFEITGLKFRLWPIVLAAVLMQGMLWPARELARWIFKSNSALFHGQIWIFVALATLLQLIVGLLAVAVMRRLLPQADAHLRRPPGRSYVGLAVVIGIAMAAIMFLADHGSDLLRGAIPVDNYHATFQTLPAYLLVMLAAGPNEEIIFRGVLVGMLAVLVPGQVRAGRFEIPIAGVLVGALFAVAHYNNFFIRPWPEALAQQAYAFAWDLIYVWLMVRSRSLLAPAIAHGLGDAVEVGAVMLLNLGSG